MKQLPMREIFEVKVVVNLYIKGVLLLFIGYGAVNEELNHILELYGQLIILFLCSWLFVGYMLY